MAKIYQLKPTLSSNRTAQEPKTICTANIWVSVQCYGRAMRAGIIGGAVLGRRVALPAWPVWSQLALGVLLLGLAVVGVCTGVLSVKFVC